jgi:hypothetical protein
MEGTEKLLLRVRHVPDEGIPILSASSAASHHRPGVRCPPLEAMHFTGCLIDAQNAYLRSNMIYREAITGSETGPWHPRPHSSSLDVHTSYIGAAMMRRRAGDGAPGNCR